MPNKSILRLLHSLTRNEFERRLGGGFEDVPDETGRRENGKYVTYKDYSKEVQERMDCFCQPLLKGAKPVSGHKWTDVAKRMEVNHG